MFRAQGVNAWSHSSARVGSRKYWEIQKAGCPAAGTPDRGWSSFFFFQVFDSRGKEDVNVVSEKPPFSIRASR